MKSLLEKLTSPGAEKAKPTDTGDLINLHRILHGKQPRRVSFVFHSHSRCRRRQTQQLKQLQRLQQLKQQQQIKQKRTCHKLFRRPASSPACFTQCLYVLCVLFCVSAAACVKSEANERIHSDR